MTKLKIAIIGAGNGGQTFAGDLGARGYDVSLFDLNRSLLEPIREQGGVYLEDRIECFGRVAKVADSLEDAVSGADLIVVVTTATAHRALAAQLAKILEPGKIVLLSPGRTCGALEFLNEYRRNGGPQIDLAEAQTLIYACRLIRPGRVRVIGVKERVCLSVLPKSRSAAVYETLRSVFPSYMLVETPLATGLENYGAMFHPPIALFNAAAIERGSEFYFYRDLTPRVADFIERLDAERVAVGKAYGVDLISAKDWISFAYPGTEGETLGELMKNNPAYYDVLAPTKIDARQLTEDIPTGIVPMADLGRAAGVDVSLMDALTTTASLLLGIDFRANGRTLRRLGLENLTANEIVRAIDER